MGLLKSSQTADTTIVAVLSIRKYLTGYGTDNTNPLLTVCVLLLEGIAKSALPYNREEYSSFRATISRLSAALEQTQEAEGLMVLVEEACEAMEGYNRG